jgi:hypothetical protein
MRKCVMSSFQKNKGHSETLEGFDTIWRAVKHSTHKPTRRLRAAMPAPAVSCVLHVAEKPSVARAVAAVLSRSAAPPRAERGGPFPVPVRATAAAAAAAAAAALQLPLACSRAGLRLGVCGVIIVLPPRPAGL